jgi:hypothetical protein
MSDTITLGMDDEILQMKMITGETILTALSPKNEKVDDSFIMICTLEMIPFDSYEDFDDESVSGTEYYILRPWVTYADNISQEISVNPTNIVYITTPSKGLKEQYFRSLAEIQKKLKVNDKEEQVPPKNVGDVIAFKPRDTKVLLNEE